MVPISGLRVPLMVLYEFPSVHQNSLRAPLRSTPKGSLGFLKGFIGFILKSSCWLYTVLKGSLGFSYHF